MALPAAAGIRYQVRNVVDNRTVLHAVATADGSNLRFDVQRGDGLLFHTGDIVIGRSGETWLTLLDPNRKTFTRLDLAQLSSSLRGLLDPAVGAVGFRVINPHASSRDLGDGGVIDGYATHRYATAYSFDVMANIGGQSAVKVRIRSAGQTWTTSKIDAAYASFAQLREIHTGIAELDSMLQQQRKIVSGFPLKEVMSTVIDFDGRKTRSTSITTVDHIEQRTFSPTWFATPTGYRKK